MAYNCWARSHKGHSLWIAEKTSTWPEFTDAYGSSGFGRFWAAVAAIQTSQYLRGLDVPIQRCSAPCAMRHAPCAMLQSYVHLTGSQVLSAPNRRAKSMEEWTNVTLRIKGYILYSKGCITQCIHVYTVQDKVKEMVKKTVSVCWTVSSLPYCWLSTMMQYGNSM